MQYLLRLTPLFTACSIVLVLAANANGQLTFGAPAYAHPAGYGDGLGESEPELAGDGPGNLVKVSLTGTFGYPPPLSVYAWRSMDGGSTWTAPVLLNDSTADRCSYPSITWAGGTTWVAIWTQRLGFYPGIPELYFARSTDGGATWSPAASLYASAATDTNKDNWVSVAADGKGNLIAAFFAILEYNTGIHYVVSNNYGQTWSALKVLQSTSDNGLEAVDPPGIATDGNGTWVCSFVRNQYDPETEQFRDQLFYKRSNNNGVSWSAAQRWCQSQG